MIDTDPPCSSSQSGRDDEIEDAFARLVEQLEHDASFDLEAALQHTDSKFVPELRSMLRTVGRFYTPETAARPSASDNQQLSFDPATSNHPRTIGDYKIIEEIGRGGMGVVYRAEQMGLRRTVALKVLPYSTTAGPQNRIRFNNEARAVASISHPNVVPVFASGEDQGVHYMAMQFIAGHTLATVITFLLQHHRRHINPTSGDAACKSINDQPIENDNGQAVSPSDVARQWYQRRIANPASYYTGIADIGYQVASALAQAHRCNVIHRDVKPSNIIIDHNAKAWLTDFGLARLDDESRITRTGDLLGTMRYMSPEQADPSSGPMDHRTDVYSLGATLYELVSLQPAHPAADRGRLMLQIQDREPLPLSTIVPDVPRPLVTIITKAMDKECGQRYANAAALAEDLQRFCNGQPILARPLSLSHRLGRHLRRNRLVIGTVLAAILLILSGGFYSAWRHAQTMAAANHQLDVRYHRAKDDLSSIMRALDRVVVPLVHRNAVSPKEFESIQQAIEIYSEIANRHRRDTHFMDEATLAYLTICLIHERFGDKHLAFDAVHNAVTIARERVKRAPTAEAKYGLCNALCSLAHTAYGFGDLALSDQASRETESLSLSLLSTMTHNQSNLLPIYVQAAIMPLLIQYQTGDEQLALTRLRQKLQEIDAACQQVDLLGREQLTLDGSFQSFDEVIPLRFRREIEAHLGRSYADPQQ